MTRSIEFCGVPGSGKSTASDIVVRMLNENGTGVLDRKRAVLRCLRKRRDGCLKDAMKRLHPFFWERFMNVDTCLDELLRFEAAHPELLAFVTGELARRVASERDRNIVLGSFFRSFVEQALFHGQPAIAETLVLDEALVHRGFTLFGYLAGSVPETELRQYAELIPLPDSVVYVTAPAELSERRLAARTGVVFQYPIQLADMEPATRVARLRRGAECLDVVIARLVERGTRVVRSDNSGSLRSLNSQCEEAVRTLDVARP